MIERLDSVEPRVLRLVVYCAMLLVVAAFVTNALVPAAKNYSKLSHAHSVLAGVAERDVGVAGEIASAEAEVVALRAQVAGDMANLPEQQMESFIVERLQAISWQNDIELGSLTPSSGANTNQYSEMLFQVEISGSYFQLVDWLGDLASELGFVVVREQQMALKKTGALKPELSMQLSLAAYRLAGVN